MPGSKIIATGRFVPGQPVTNDVLSRVMDTNDAWIRQRTGVAQRHFSAPGQGVSDLGAAAAKQALEAGNIDPASIDYVIFATMTPEYVFPGSGPMAATKLGLQGVPALDIRQQCAAFPYALQVADGLLASGAAKRVLLIAAEAHAGMMPWKRWDRLRGEGGPVEEGDADFERATRHRGYAVIFGDGAGACVLERSQAAGEGLLYTHVASDGAHFDQIYIPGVGFLAQPFVDAGVLAEERELPQMKGRELFKLAVTRLPDAIRKAAAGAGVEVSDIDWFLAHQANDRINAAVRDAMKLPEAKVPSNIARYGNTSGATIPILLDELRESGDVKSGQLVCFFALGAGLNWGASIMRI